MKQQQTLQPKLRFPEFEGDWNEKRLREISEIIGGGTPDTNNISLWNGEINWFTPTEITKKYLTKSTRTISELGLKKSSAKILKKGTILFTSRATIGSCGILLNEATTNQGFQSFYVNGEYYNEFIYYWILNSIDTFTRLSSGSTFLEISKTQIEKIKINIPTLLEQQKIADYLSTIDIKINLLNEKKAQLALYKKAMMQKLFSQEIRFKPSKAEALEAYPEWEEKRLGEVFSGLKGQGLSKDSLLDEGENNCILYGELFTKYKEVIKSVISKTNTLSGVISKNGDILIPASTTTNAFDLSNATALLVDNVILGGDINILRPKQKLSSEFYAYYLSNFKKYELGKLGQGITIVHLYYTHFKNIMIDLPSLPEQQKIANFLSAIDESIEKVTEQISQTQSFKKAMLQQLFV